MKSMTTTLSHRRNSSDGQLRPGHRAGPLLPEREFMLFSTFITEYCGIKVPPSKKTMIEARLAKRLRALKLTSFSEYADYLFSPTGMERETPLMINVVTTNKTDFFREPAHFEYLAKCALPRLAELQLRRQRTTIHAWSAGCSSGEEAYTLAMVLNEFTEKHCKADFSILATDVCTTVLQKGKTGIYEKEKIASINPNLKHKYFMKGKNNASELCRIVPELRAKVQFRHLNFMAEEFCISKPMEIIFCRNVLIYFERATQEYLINRFCDHLVPGGYIFLGHAETLNGMAVPLKQVSSAIYRINR